MHEGAAPPYPGRVRPGTHRPAGAPRRGSSRGSAVPPGHPPYSRPPPQGRADAFPAWAPAPTGRPRPAAPAEGTGVRFPCRDADAIELRVLGSLLEKQRTTPDQYPLSLNALRLACNQTTNRDPVASYEEGEIHEALQRLARRGWTRLASGAGSRAAKYRQLFDEA